MIYETLISELEGEEGTTETPATPATEGEGDDTEKSDDEGSSL